MKVKRYSYQEFGSSQNKIPDHILGKVHSIVSQNLTIIE